MASNDPRQYLIAYDIADPRRLGRLHRYLKAWAVPVQYSVFTAAFRPAQLQMLIAGIEEIIHVGQDDVRIYPLRRDPQAVVIGGTRLPDGIHVLPGCAEITLRSEQGLSDDTVPASLSSTGHS